MKNTEIEFAIWYSGMDREKVESAFQRWLKEKPEEKNELIPSGWIVGSDFEANHHDKIEAEIFMRMSKQNPATTSVWFSRDFRAGVRFGISLFQEQTLQIKPIDDKLKRHSEDVSLLQQYSEFLQSRGYIDVDWIAEQPTAIDEFMKTRKI